MIEEYLEKLSNRIRKKISVLEEKKQFAEGRKFNSILDEIYELSNTLEQLDKLSYYASLDKSKYKIVVVAR